MGLKQEHPTGALFHEQGEVGKDISAQHGGDGGGCTGRLLQDVKM